MDLIGGPVKDQSEKLLDRRSLAGPQNDPSILEDACILVLLPTSMTQETQYLTTWATKSSNSELSLRQACQWPWLILPL